MHTLIHLFFHYVIGEMRLWKAILILAIITSLAGYGIWYSRTPHSIDAGTLSLEPASVRGQGFMLDRPYYITVELTPPPGSNAPYIATIVTLTNLRALTNPNAADISGYARVEGSGTLKLGPVSLNAGSYQLLIVNKDNQPLDVKFNLLAKKKKLTWDDDPPK